MSPSFALLTKTYSGDFTDFARLCASIDRHMPQFMHHVIVDSVDQSLFAPFAGSNRKIAVAETLLPQFRPIALPGRRFWFKSPRYFVRGWIFQQLAKLKLASMLTEDAVLLVDSDVVFLRPLQTNHVFEGAKVKLYHWPGVPSGPPSESGKWHSAACRALGLPARGYTGADYISTVIAWSPAVVRAMLDHIASATRMAWTDALLRDFRFSECVLYGVFCQHVAGPHADLVKPTRETLCHWSWPYNLDHPAGTDAYVDGLRPDKVAALLQSNLGIGDMERAEIFARLQELASSQAPADAG